MQSARLESIRAEAHRNISSLTFDDMKDQFDKISAYALANLDEPLYVAKQRLWPFYINLKPWRRKIGKQPRFAQILNVELASKVYPQLTALLSRTGTKESWRPLLNTLSERVTLDVNTMINNGAQEVVDLTEDTEELDSTTFKPSDQLSGDGNSPAKEDSKASKERVPDKNGGSALEAAAECESTEELAEETLDSENGKDSADERRRKLLNLKAKKATLKKRMEVGALKAKKAELEKKLKNPPLSSRPLTPTAADRDMESSALVITNISQTGPEHLVRFLSPSVENVHPQASLEDDKNYQMESAEMATLQGNNIDDNTNLKKRKVELAAQLAQARLKRARLLSGKQAESTAEASTSKEEPRLKSSLASLTREELLHRKTLAEYRSHVTHLKHIVSKQEVMLESQRVKLKASSSALNESVSELKLLKAQLIDSRHGIELLESRKVALCELEKEQLLQLQEAKRHLSAMLSDSQS